MAKGDQWEAEAMTAMLTGFVSAALMKLDEVLTPPVTLEEVDPDGIVRVRLASGMLVTIRISTDPLLASAKSRNV